NDSSELQSLLGDPYGGDLIVGRTDGSHPCSVKIKAGSWQCLIDRMPCGSTVSMLPSGLGNATINRGACNTNPVPLPVNAAGQFKNNLLGQTISLALNLRYDKLKNGGNGNLES